MILIQVEHGNMFGRCNICVIVYKPSGVDVDMSVLKECFNRNPDGGGVMYAEDGVLKVAKGFMKWRSLKRYLKRMTDEKKTGLPFVFHFRIATHGSISPPNCHPFHIHEGMAMVHNGVMSNIPIAKDSDISDSEAFIQLYVKGLSYDLGMGSLITIEQLEHGSPLNDLYDRFVGSSKLLFMDGFGDVAIVNESLGYWEKTGSGKGMWFSNRMWKPVVVHAAKKTVTSHLGYSGRGFNNNAFNKPTTNTKLSWDKGHDDYYCLDCHLLFMRSEARRVLWTMANEQIVCCPDCDSENTLKAEELHNTGWLGG